MDEEHTTVVVQRYLDELAGGAPAEPVIRALLDRAVRRLGLLCGALLHRSYPRLTRPPLNLQADEMLSAVVERLLKALREARPTAVRHSSIGECESWSMKPSIRRRHCSPSRVRGSRKCAFTHRTW